MQKLKEKLHHLHRKQVSGKEYPAQASTEAHTCLNCGNTFTDNFCNRCGQSVKTSRYTFRSGLQNILRDLTSLDHGIIHTLGDLIFRPGYMISDYISGKRVRYFRPFQMLFVLAAIYLLLIQILDPAALDNKKTPVTVVPDSEVSSGTENNDRALHDSSDETLTAAADKKDPDQVDFEKRYISLKKDISRHPVLHTAFSIVQRWSRGNKAATILCIIPLLAVSARISFRKASFNGHYNLTEQMIVQTYIACMVLLISIVAFLFREKAMLNSLYDVPFWIVILLYLYVYKQLFRDNWWKTGYRTLFMLLYSILILFILTFSIAIVFILVTTVT